MKYSTFVPAILFLGSSIAAQVTPRNPTELTRRALPNAPDLYIPTADDCPSTKPSVRIADALSTNEKTWLEARRKKTVPAMRDLLVQLNINGFDANKYFQDNEGNGSALPNIGLAFSGGGYRACLNGAGAVQAFDSRESVSKDGKLGGLLQSSTYIAGLSGGGWLVGSIYINNFTTVSSLQQDNSGSLWEFGRSIAKGPEKQGIQTLGSAEYFKTIFDQVQAKKDAGYETTITDYWGRALSFQMINATEGGPNYTISSIRDQPGFSQGEMPFPMWLADSRVPGESLVPGNTSVWEFNPYEFGTWDPTTYGFLDLQFLGSNFSNGKLPDDEQCVRGFDNAGYIMGTSSSLFNQFLINLDSTTASDTLRSILGKILTRLGNDKEDIANYSPNPFKGFNPSGKNLNVNQNSLTLVDGGSDLQNIPLHPLVQPSRNVDVIFAVDSSADTPNNWPNGTAMVATYERSLAQGGIANGTSFPAVPDVNTFVNLGLNTRPTFFGCDPKNTTSLTPLVVYLPNSPYVFFSNISTFTPTYTNDVRDAIIKNGFQVATMGNATVDKDWPQCVGCAILSRSFDRAGSNLPDVCSTCFKNYCWDGTTNSTTPAPYAPKTRFDPLAVKDAGVMLGASKTMLGVSILAAAILLA